MHIVSAVKVQGQNFSPLYSFLLTLQICLISLTMVPFLFSSLKDAWLFNVMVIKHSKTKIELYALLGKHEMIFASICKV